MVSCCTKLLNNYQRNARGVHTPCSFCFFVRLMTKSTFFSLVLFFLFLLFATPPYAQGNGSGIVRGRITDSVQGGAQERIKGATIAVFSAKDSVPVKQVLSGPDGSFRISQLAFGSYLLRISFMGYVHVEQSFVLLGEKPLYDAGVILLKKEENMMDNIIIRASSMALSGDTTEFSASQFKTIPNASTEDLLKKLPGVEVERDGSIKAQGEPVTRVLVDGKPFYSNDPKMATKNLPADIIEKIQVIDAPSEQSAFSGFDDGNRIRTINIITKKNRKKGVFGKGSLAEGTDGRYAHALSANLINGERKISFLGQANNINNQNFTVQDFLGSLNPSGNSGGGGVTNIYSGNANGISTTNSGGINFNDTWKTKTKLSASYFYNDINSTNNRIRYRETFVPNDSSLFNENDLISTSRNKNHRFNMELDHTFDSSNSVLFKSTYNFQETHTLAETSSFTTKGKVNPFNALESNSSSLYSGFWTYNSLLFRHRFKKRGRSFSVQVAESSNGSDRSGTFLSFNNRYVRGIDTVDQVNGAQVKGLKTWTTLSYTEPLTEKAQLEFNIQNNTISSRSDQQTFKRDKLTQSYTVLVPNLTNVFENSNLIQRAGVNYRKQVSKQWNYAFGLALQRAALKSNNLSTGSVVQQQFLDYLPNFSLQFRQGRSKTLRLNYRGATQQPNVSQLQDVINNNNILFVRAGNPFLRQEFAHNLNLTYNSIDMPRARNFYLSLTAIATANKIGNAVTLNSSKDSMLVDGYMLVPGAQFTKPQNLDGSYDIRISANYSFTFKDPKLVLNIGSSLTDKKDVNLFNGIESYIHNYIVGGRIRASVNIRDWLDLGVSSNTNLNFTRYTLSTRQDVDFLGQRFSFEPTITTSNGWIVSNDVDYILNRGNAITFNQSIPLWNAGLAKLFLKGRAGELRLTVFDLLNTNRNIVRNVELNYVEDIRTQVLKRYFLMSFTYHIRKFKGAERKS
jgi:hypothetical protein